MSRFSDAMAMGNEALLDAMGDLHTYWPGGEEDNKIEILAIWTDYMTGQVVHQYGSDENAKAEAQIWADDVRGVATPQIQLDLIRHGDHSWRVVGIMESVGGMHRLAMERVNRDIVGHGRGMR